VSVRISGTLPFVSASPLAFDWIIAAVRRRSCCSPEQLQ
jgi:hypothetical protein